MARRLITLQVLQKTLPKNDYAIEKEDALYKILDNLTPKFTGRWVFVLVDPSIEFVLKLLDNAQFPEWIDVLVCTSRKKIDRIVEVKPVMLPKEETVKDAYDKAVAAMQHIITPKASKYLYASLRSNREALLTTLQKLDTECETGVIELKDVQAEVVKPNIVYASKVVEAFLLGEKQRWTLLGKLLSDIGPDIAYYAMRKHVNRLLLDKDKYLRNEDVHNRLLGKVDAPSICLLYSLFATSTSYQQLNAILLQFDLRIGVNSEEEFLYADFQ